MIFPSLLFLSAVLGLLCSISSNNLALNHDNAPLIMEKSSSIAFSYVLLIHAFFFCDMGIFISGSKCFMTYDGFCEQIWFFCDLFHDVKTNIFLIVILFLWDISRSYFLTKLSCLIYHAKYVLLSLCLSSSECSLIFLHNFTNFLNYVLQFLNSSLSNFSWPSQNCLTGIRDISLSPNIPFNIFFKFSSGIWGWCAVWF